MSTVTVVGMIYKSPSYLDFMMRGVYKYCYSNKYTVNHLIVANDASEKILSKLTADGIAHIVYRDHKPDDYYMNRIYRAWNFGGKEASGDIIVFINSDMGFTNGWLDALLDQLNPNTIPCSLLVESGKLSSAEHAISKDFGRTAESYKESDFLRYARSIKRRKCADGGLFMPCAIYKSDFIASGGYPEGNIYEGGAGAYQTKLIGSGDHYYFYKNPVMRQKKHITVFDSIVYHIQEGEKDE